MLKSAVTRRRPRLSSQIMRPPCSEYPAHGDGVDAAHRTVIGPDTELKDERRDVLIDMLRERARV